MTSIRDELDMDVYTFGELVLEVLTEGRLGNAEVAMRSLRREDLIREINKEGGISPSSSLHEDLKSAVEVALLCTRSRPSDRPTMKDAVKLLPQPKGKA